MAFFAFFVVDAFDAELEVEVDPAGAAGEKRENVT